LLESAVARQQYAGYHGRRQPRDIFSVAATLFFGLIKNHPFHDANKRTALLTVLFQLYKHNRVATESQTEFERLTIAVAENSLDTYPGFRDIRKEDGAELRFIASHLRRLSRKLDPTQLQVSFRQLSQILSRHGFSLANPRDNRIDVVRQVERRSGIFGLRRTLVIERVTSIGFRDWGTHVSPRDLRTTRQATGLTYERGFDAHALTKGLDPMETLLAAYVDPLRRLARK
jgi:death-on-curing protein